MSTVEVVPPDALAHEAIRAGMLALEKIEHMLRERLRMERIGRMQVVRATLAAEPLRPMTPEELAAEIAAWRSEQRRAAVS